MKLLIAGSRDVDVRIALYEFLNEVEMSGELSLRLEYNNHAVDELVTGCCPTGPDQIPYVLNKLWSKSGYGTTYDITEFPAQWDNISAPGAVIKTNNYGKKYNAKAGMDRNMAMARYADAAIVIMKKSGSNGSENMIKCMQMLNKPVNIILV
jgi:hypothetical protein